MASVDGDEGRALAMLEKSLACALDALGEGEKNEYDRMLDLMRQSLASDACVLWFQAITTILHALSDQTGGLVEAMLSFPHAAASPAALRAFEALTLQVCLEHHYHAPLIVLYYLRAMAHNDVPHGRAEPEHLLRVTYVLSSLVREAPASTDVVFQLLYEHYPRPWEGSAVHHNYVQGCFRLAHACPGLDERIMALVIDNVIVLDVQLDDAVRRREEQDDTEDVLQFSVELDERHVSQEELAERLDLSLHSTFSYINSLCVEEEQAGEAGAGGAPVALAHSHGESAEGGRGSPAPSGLSRSGEDVHVRREAIFRLLLKIFDRAVLATSGTRFVQFVLFYVACMEPTFPTQFLGYLVRTAIDVSVAAVIRQRALAYVGSFVSRARFVTNQTVCTILQAVLEWALAYVQQHQGKAVIGFKKTRKKRAKVDPSEHVVFYSAVQMLMYIVCFRPEAVEEHGERGYLARVGFEALISSPLNPLRFCLESVVHEFAHVAARLGQELSVQEVMAANASQYGPARLDADALGAFFPFDPFLLKRCSHFIDGLYISWGDDEGEGEGEGEFEEEEDEEGESEEYSHGSVSEQSSFTTPEQSPKYVFAVPPAPSAESPELGGMQLEELMSITPDVKFDLDFHFSHCQ